jgi:hypothetical protein
MAGIREVLDKQRGERWLAAAKEAYRASVARSGIKGTPEWEDLDADIQANWVAAVRQTQEGGDPERFAPPG